MKCKYETWGELRSCGLFLYTKARLVNQVVLVCLITQGVKVMKKIGFIGVGVMGKSMVRNLMKQGYSVSVYARNKDKVQDVLSEGAEWSPSVAECVSGKDVLITIVGFPKDVEEVYFGRQGILEAAGPGTYLIDMTTTSPELDQRIYAAAMEKEVHMLDAPVTGGDIGAKTAQLTILVGGQKEDFEACYDLFSAMGSKIFYMGPSGNGQKTKLANQVAIAGTIAGVCEAVSFAQKVGLDADKTLEAISGGAAGSFQMSSNGPKILKQDYAPGFFIKHYVKDMLLARDELDKNEASLKILEDVLAMYQALEKRGLGDEGTQSLIKYYLD